MAYIIEYFWSILLFLQVFSSCHDHVSYIHTDLCHSQPAQHHSMTLLLSFIYYVTPQTLSYNHTCSYLHTCLSVTAARYQKALKSPDKVAMRQPSCTHFPISRCLHTCTAWPRAINLSFWTKCLWARIVHAVSIPLCTLSLYLSESST